MLILIILQCKCSVAGPVKGDMGAQVTGIPMVLYIHELKHPLLDLMSVLPLR